MSVRMVWGEYIFFFLCLIHGRWDEYLAFLENHSSWWWLAQYESSLEVIWEWHFIIICLQCGRPECDPCVCKVPWRREWQLTPVFLPGKFHGQRKLAGYSPWDCKELDTTKWLSPWASLVAQRLKRLPPMRETWVQSLGREDTLEKEMVTHFSILAWKILWTEKPGRLQSAGLQRVGHDWATSPSPSPSAMYRKAGLAPGS